MDYSVWDYRQKQYDYFKAPGEEPATGSFRAPLGGLDCPERLAVPLPPGAEFVGSGRHARGEIATTDQGLARLVSGRATSAVDGSGGAVNGLGDVGEPPKSGALVALAALGALWLGTRS